MNKKITLFLFGLFASIALFAQLQTYSLTVCGYIQTPNSSPYNNVVTMSLMANGAVISTQTDSMNGSPQICFQPVAITDAIGNGVNYTATITLAGCSPISQGGILNSTQMINIPLSFCNTNCSANITSVNQGSNSYILQANASGIAPFTYLWSGGSGASSIPLTQPGVYNVYVTDATGCVTSASFNTAISGYMSISLTNPTSTTLTPVLWNGLSPFTYNWSNGSTSSNITVNDISPTNYCVTVTDAIGASVTICDTVGNCQAYINQSALGVSQDYLQGYSTGFAPYTYLWSNGDTTQTIYPSQNGVYTLVITDATGCSSIATYNYVYTSFCDVSISSIPTSNTSYQLTANPVGTPPFSYAWNGSSPNLVDVTPSIDVNVSGVYCVSIIDGTGCVANFCDTISFGNMGCTATITASVDSTGFTTLTASNGLLTQPGISYTWSLNNTPLGLGTSSPDLPAVQVGTYCVFISDLNGCMASACYNYTGGLNCQTTITNTSSVSFPASLTASSSGIAPFNYVWTDTNGVVLPSTSEIYYLTTNGYYCCEITDANGCVSESCYNVNNFISSCSTTVTSFMPPNVPPNTVMGLMANTTNGTAPFAYSWYYNFQMLADTTMSITVSQNGIYVVNVVDALGCLSTDTIYMNLNSGNCSADITWTSNPIGGITYTAIGIGVAPYNYIWSTGTNSQSIVSTQPGTYSVTIIDALGCTATASIVDSLSSFACNATLTMSSPILGIPPTLTASGSGVAPLAFSWSLNGITIPASTQSLSPNGVGTYCVVITDANGCTAQSCYYVNNGNCTTFISDTVAWNAHILTAYSTGVAPYTYQWYLNNTPTLDTVSTIIPMQTGIYTVVVTDANGCTSLGNYFFNYTACLPNTSLGFGLNAVTSITAGSTGVAPFTYSWTLNGLPLVGGQTVNISINGTYCYTVIDANGCMVSDCYTTTTTPLGNCTAYFTSTPDSLYLPSSNMALIDFVAYPNGSPQFSYLWTFSDGTTDTVANPQHLFVASPNSWAWASLTITDASGCVSVYSNSVFVPYFQQNCSAFFTESSAYSSSAVGEVSFQNLSSSLATSATYLWSFDDGTTSTQQNPTHTFTTNGYYNVMLTVNDNGCVSNYSQLVYIDLSWWGNNPYGGNCTAGFILVPASGVNGVACLIDISQANNPSYTWNSSNGFMSNSTTPFFNLNGTGTYTLCVTVTDTLSGCSDTFCDSLTVDSLGNVFKTSNTTFLSANASVAIAVVASPKSTNTTGISDVANAKSMSIQPNPANENLTINLGKLENAVVNIIDVTGSIVKELKLNNAISNVDVSGLSNGTYFVKVISEKNNETLKLIINH